MKPRKICITPFKLPRARISRRFGRRAEFSAKGGPADGGAVLLRTFSSLPIEMRGFRGRYERGTWIHA